MKNKSFKDILNTVVEFIKKYQRYCYAGVLFVVLVLLLIFATGKPSTSSENVAEEEVDYVKLLENFTLDAEYEVDAYADINTLISNYLNAYAMSDLETLKSYATPVSDNEAGYIGLVSAHIENFQNIKCYTMKGLTEGSYMVSVYYDIKFNDIETLSPTLDFFYVETNEDGQFYINNVYSNYNYSHQENALNTEIATVIQMFLEHDSVVALRNDVKASYNSALAADENLYTLITNKIPAEIRVWADSIAKGTVTDTQTEDTQTEDTQPEETETPEETASEEPQQTETKVTVTKNRVNVREAASSDGAVLGRANSGDTYTKLGVDGEWVQIDYNGATGYISASFVEDVQ